MKGALEAREQKMARFIGMTSHTNGEVMAQAIRRNELDCVQMALNASRNGRFEELALPEARKKNLGIIAMKVTGQEYLLGSGSGKTDIKSLLRYSMSLPVTTAVVGMPRLEMLEHNIETGAQFLPTARTARWRNSARQLTPARDGLEKTTGWTSGRPNGESGNISRVMGRRPTFIWIRRSSTFGWPTLAFLQGWASRRLMTAGSR